MNEDLQLIALLLGTALFLTIGSFCYGRHYEKGVWEGLVPPAMDKLCTECRGIQ